MPQQDIYDVVSLKTDGDKQSMKGFIEEAVRSKQRIKMEQEAMKDIRNEAKDKLGVTPKLFNKLVKAVHKQDLGKEKQEFEEFEAVLELIYPSKNP